MSNLHKRQVYSGLLEIVKDSKYYYQSKVNSEYNKFTDEGVSALVEYVNQVAPYILKKEHDELVDLAKNLLWNELKK